MCPCCDEIISEYHDRETMTGKYIWDTLSQDLKVLAQDFLVQNVQDIWVFSTLRQVTEFRSDGIPYLGTKGRTAYSVSPLAFT